MTELTHIARDLRDLAVPVAELHPDPVNARKHPDRNVESVMASLARFGQQRPVVVRKETMTVVAGNCTLEAAKRLGWESLAASIEDMDSVTAAAYAIADNRTAELAEWDDEVLAKLLLSIGDEVDPEIMGFTDEELKAILSPQHDPNEDRAGAGERVPLPDGAELIAGHTVEALNGLPADSVHCVVTSPPYWGLRNYGLPASVWGGDKACDHEWGGEQAGRMVGNNSKSMGKDDDSGQFSSPKQQEIGRERAIGGRFCAKCNAWEGCLGLEPTPDHFLRNLVEVFEAVRRVLRPDGVCWVNLGDCYAQSGSSAHIDPVGAKGVNDHKPTRGNAGLSPKQRLLMPARMAIALQEAGWWVRSEIVWAKPNPMPSSVTDRPTDAHEMIYMLTKAPRYFYDGDAIRSDANEGGRTLTVRNRGTGSAKDNNYVLDGRVGANARTVWWVPTHGYKEAHFATYPERLVEPAILVSTSPKGCCAECGAPVSRMVEVTGGAEYVVKDASESANKTPDSSSATAQAWETGSYQRRTKGWERTCECATADTQPCTVLDPFNGSGTTGVVALRFGCRYIGIDLSEEYLALASRRIAGEEG